MATIKIGGLSISGKDLKATKDGKVYVDGQLIEDISALNIRDGILEVRVIEGTLENLTAEGDVTVTGTIKGTVTANGRVECDAVGGSVQAGGSIKCGRIGGNATAVAGNIRHA